MTFLNHENQDTTSLQARLAATVPSLLSGFSVYTYDHHGQGLSGRLPVPKGADTTVAHIL